MTGPPDGCRRKERGRFSLSSAISRPVYELLGKKGLGTTEMPKQETGLIEGEIAFRQHAGGHTTGPNGPTFLRFAQRYFAGRSAGAAKPAPGN